MCVRAVSARIFCTHKQSQKDAQHPESAYAQSRAESEEG